MDWLKKLPVVGPPLARLMATHAWRSFERLDRVKWTRLAAAMTFTSFVALFPLLTVAAAIVAAAFGKDKQSDLQHKIADQVPGISDQLDIDGLVQNSRHRRPHRGRRPAVHRHQLGRFDARVSAGGLGTARAGGKPGPARGQGLRDPPRARWRRAGHARRLHHRLRDDRLDHRPAGHRPGLAWGSVLLRIAAFLVAVLADFLLLLYVLTLLPGVEPRRRRLFVAALTGAVGFELLKLLLSGYMQGVAAKSMYGAFGVPVALLLWINFTSKLVLFCAAWTATQSKEVELTDESDGVPDRAAASGG